MVALVRLHPSCVVGPVNVNTSLRLETHQVSAVMHTVIAEVPSSTNGLKFCVVGYWMNDFLAENSRERSDLVVFGWIYSHQTWFTETLNIHRHFSLEFDCCGIRTAIS